ncbi:hypothetical protein DFH06DRAFT_1199737 [Mycena polygramma]|nr:hypothetical protein DFH06DRAFT_1199737 [Mycena polygramma]
MRGRKYFGTCFMCAVWSGLSCCRNSRSSKLSQTCALSLSDLKISGLRCPTRASLPALRVSLLSVSSIRERFDLLHIEVVRLHRTPPRPLLALDPPTPPPHPSRP